MNGVCEWCVCVCVCVCVLRARTRVCVCMKLCFCLRTFMSACRVSDIGCGIDSSYTRTHI